MRRKIQVGMKKNKKNYYPKNLVKSMSNSNTESLSKSYVDELNQQIIYLQNEKMELEKKMKDFFCKTKSMFSQWETWQQYILNPFYVTGFFYIRWSHQKTTEKDIKNHQKRTSGMKQVKLKFSFRCLLY